MTNRERLSKMTDEELAEIFCDTLEMAAGKKNLDVCDICPFNKLCKKGNNGFLRWLKAEAEEDTNA